MKRWIGAVYVAIVSMVVGPGGEAMAGLIEHDGDRLILRHGEASLAVSLRSPQFTFSLDGAPAGDMTPAQVAGDPMAGDGLRVTYPQVSLSGGISLDVVVRVQWSSEEQVLRKWAEYRLSGPTTAVTLDDVTFDSYDAELLNTPFRAYPPRSMPALLDDFFVGIEFPVAATRIEDDQIIVGHKPCRDVLLDSWETTRTAVYGLAHDGDARRAFHRYIEHHRPEPKGLHINYNSWWTSPVPFSEADILNLMKAFAENLYEPHGVGFDTFTIDMGWSNSRSIWEIDEELFPDGFTNIQEGAERMGGFLGLWTSPASHYAAALDNDWAREAGYETLVVPHNNHRLLSLGGERYAKAFKEQLADLVGRYDIRQVKLDGYYLGSNNMAEPYSSEDTAEGGIAAFKAMREANPNVWLEGTFDSNASPWWLFYLNSVIGMFGDDSPFGRVPCPIYRESYTTARDFYNFQGADWLLSPIAAQEILGVLHQSPEPFLNDAVVNVLRGHAFLLMYINPAYMNEHRWSLLAELIQWARQNEVLLVGRETLPLRPTSWPEETYYSHVPYESNMPREPYGYAHWDGATGMVLLRNPWIAPQTRSIRLGEDDVSMSASVNVVSLYPEIRVYGENLAIGDMLDIVLAPYETVVLSIKPGQAVEGLPSIEERIGGRIHVERSTVVAEGIQFDHMEERFGPNWTRLMEGETLIEVEFSGDVTLEEPNNRFLFLLEGKESLPVGEITLEVNGSPVPLRPLSSADGFTATWFFPIPEQWTFYEAALGQGRHTLALEAVFDNICTRFSAWIWTTREGEDGADYPNRLPEPEWVSQDAAALIEPTGTQTLPAKEGVAPVIERIDGIFLDAIDPISVTQGWGDLQRNRSVWEKPLTIGSERYLRGLGVHAESRIVYELDDAYRRFEAWVGPDGANRGTVTFEVYVDDVKQWESGIMTSSDSPRKVEVDVSGAWTLTLVVGDGGDGIDSDHANWADAKLVR